MYATLLGLLEARCSLRLHILYNVQPRRMARNHAISWQLSRTTMIRRLQRHTAEAPHWGDEQHRYGNYRLTEGQQMANNHHIASGSLEAVWNIQVAHE